MHYKLEKFGIIAKGEHRVINEFQNGDIYMIEKNKPIDFVGEVTILPITAARGFFDLSAARLYLQDPCRPRRGSHQEGCRYYYRFFRYG